MKITIKLSKEEAIAFNNMKKSLVPEDVDTDSFCKSVFFMGLEQFHKNTMELMQNYVKENQEKLRNEGVDVDAILSSGSEQSTEDTANDAESNND